MGTLALADRGYRADGGILTEPTDNRISPAEHPPRVEWILDADCAEVKPDHPIINTFAEACAAASHPFRLWGMGAHTDMGIPTDLAKTPTDSRDAFTLRYIPYSLVKTLCSWRTSDADSCWMKPPNLARLTARIWSAIISAFFRRQTSCKRWAQLGCNLLVNGQTTAIVV